MTKRDRKKAGARATAKRRGEENAIKTGKVVHLAVGSNDNQRGQELTGLQWLLAKRKITRQQATAGNRYGRDWRICQINGVEPIRSHLDDSPRGAGDGVPGMSHAEIDVVARQELELARDALAHHDMMVDVCDLICGRQMRPREITTVQRDQERMENTLSIALDLLTKHYGLRSVLTA